MTAHHCVSSSGKQERCSHTRIDDDSTAIEDAEAVGRYQQDTVMVAPGQRVDVLVSASELGVWAFHCQILSHAENEQGMYGMVTAFIVKW
jgi:FtsP/CotA-like multicopper oxidase with cupredoxin domain